MSWLKSLSSQANAALKTTVASIDKALDIKEQPDALFEDSSTEAKLKKTFARSKAPVVDVARDDASPSDDGPNVDYGMKTSDFTSPKSTPADDDFFAEFGVSATPKRTSRKASRTSRSQRSSASSPPNSTGTTSAAKSARASARAAAEPAGGTSQAEDVFTESTIDTPDKTDRTEQYDTSAGQPAASADAEPEAGVTEPRKDADGSSDDGDGTTGITDPVNDAGDADNHDRTPFDSSAAHELDQINDVEESASADNSAAAADNSAAAAVATLSTTMSDTLEEATQVLSVVETQAEAEQAEQVVADSQATSQPGAAHADKNGADKDDPNEDGADKEGAGTDVDVVDVSEDVPAAASMHATAVEDAAEHVTSQTFDEDISMTRVASSMLEGAEMQASAEKYAQKVAQLSITLNAREEKILDLTRESDSLRESLAVLQSQNEQLEQQLEDDLQGQLDRLTAEFSVRLSSLETKLREACRDRDSYKSKFEQVTSSHSTAAEETARLTQKLLEEKDELIEELRREAQKLSDKQYKSSNINKKLQAKNKEAEEKVASLNKQLETMQSKLTKVEQELDAKTEAERQSRKAASEVNSLSQTQSKELKSLKDEAAQLQSNNITLQSTLDKAYKEIEALQQARQEALLQAEQAKEQADLVAQEDLQSQLEQRNKDMMLLTEDFQAQIGDLRSALSRAETNASRREAHLKQEIEDAQGRLRLAEERSQETSMSVTSATQPLLRQIATMQEAALQQQSGAEAVEANLRLQLQQLKQSLAQAEENEREASGNLSSLNAKLTTSQEKVASLRRELNTCKADLDSARRKAEDLADQVKMAESRLETARTEHQQASEGWHRERLVLERKVLEERQSLTEQYTVAMNDLRSQHQAALSEAQREPARQPSTSSARSPLSPGTSTGAIAALMDQPQTGRSGGTVADDGSKAALIESLQAQKRELEAAQTAMSDELVELVRKNDALTQSASELTALQAQHEDLNNRYQHLLQMYGEKAEEAQELQMDLDDIKSVLKSQTTQFLQQIEDLKTGRA
eukprot:TRINITY_DN9465_c0_g2_i1.p1 TRINITY_DN9465_c0_g2~~TRINITY_DN9465_c0_g2_i1.p1  ORF type:complete len:1034 (+),score=351.34 TRINITY_DN9465_c0_g2_i1:104-3205(+)